MATDAPITWMGIGIFDRLYSEKKISLYFHALDSLVGKKMFILADETTGTNNFVLNGRKHDTTAYPALLEKYKLRAREKFRSKEQSIQSLMVTSHHPADWDVQYWRYLSANSEYTLLLNQLRESIAHFENHYLKKEVLKVTIFGFGARLRKNFTSSFVDFVFDKNFYRYLETLSEYTLTELAAIFHFARMGWVKAGHDEEKPYDELAMLFYDRFKDDFLTGPAPKFYYLYS